MGSLDHEFENDEVDVFDPTIHLAPARAASTFTFAELGMTEPGDEHRIAGSNPFPFLSWEGVLAYRRSILRSEVLDNCGRPFGEGALILRNVASRSRFVKDLWTHPETLATIRTALAVDVDIIMPYEIGHTNIQLANPNNPLGCLTTEPPMEAVALTEDQKNYDPLSADSIIPWHYDSYPYVCIIMLSHTNSMVGGHTYIQTADEKPTIVEGPSIGSAVVLQGGRVRHLASRAFGSAERITTISSFRLSTTGTWDNSYISNVRPYDDLPALYHEWSMYRLKKMREEIEAMEARLRDPSSRRPDEGEVGALCSQLSAYSMRTARQMTKQCIRDEVVFKFGDKKVVRATDSWLKMRGSAAIREKAIAATESTADFLPEMQPYFLDWHQTKAQLLLGIPQMSTNGPLIMDAVDEYLFPDELARQGLNELLIYWLDRYDFVI